MLTGVRLLALTAAALGALHVTHASAQQIPPNAGSLLREFREPPPIPTRPSAEIDAVPEPRPIIREAPGLSLEVKAFRITGLTVVTERELLPLLEEYVGPERSFEDLDDAAWAVTDHLRSAGYFLAQAYLPAQKVEDGVVEIAVLEGRIGQVRVESEDDIPVSRRIIDGILSALAPGTVIRDDTIERSIFLVGDLRGLEIRTVLEPGEEPGTADLVVFVEPGRRFQGNLIGTNEGSRYTGEYRVGATLEWNSPLRRGGVFSARVQQSIEGRLTFGRFSYLTPLGPFGTKVGGAYSSLDYELGEAEFEDLNANGSAEVISGFALHPFVRARNLNFFGTFGIDHRRLLDDFRALDFENRRVLDVSVFALVGDSRDPWLGGGINTFSLSFTAGRVDIRSGLQKLFDASDSGLGTDGRYNKWNMEFSRLQNLGNNFFGFLSLGGQIASKNLDSSEKMSLGGTNAVRAYAEGEAASDTAFKLTAELRKTLPIPGWLELPGHAVGMAFFDYAKGDINEIPPPGFPDNSRSLAGVGIGLRWGLPDSFLMNLTASWRLTDRPTSDTRDRTPRIFFSFTKDF